MVVLGLLIDFGVVAIQRTRLDSATEAAAHAALYSCTAQNNLNQACAEAAAEGYLLANFPGAALEGVVVTAPAGVTVSASVQARRVFGEALRAAPMQIQSAFSGAMQTGAAR